MGSTAHSTRVTRGRRTAVTGVPVASVAVAAVAVAVLGVAACAGSDDDAARESATEATAAAAGDAPAELLTAGGVDGAEADAPTAAPPESAERPAGGDGGVGALLAPADAQLAIEARARVQVDDVRAAVDGVRVAVDRAGGRVASASIAYPGGAGAGDSGDSGDPGDDSGDGSGDDPDGRPTATLTVLVPPDQLGAMLERLEGLGELTSFDQFAEDVGDQLTDLDTRIANARASVDRARELLQEATSLQDLVFLEDELTRRETDLELLLAAQAELEGRVALSTLTVEITEAAAPATEPASGRGVADAFANGWDAFVTAVLTVAVGLAAAAPFLVALAVGVMAYLAARRWRRTATAASTSAAAPTAGAVSGEPEREPVPASSAEPGSRPG